MVFNENKPWLQKEKRWHKDCEGGAGSFGGDYGAKILSAENINIHTSVHHVTSTIIKKNFKLMEQNINESNVMPQ